MSLSSLVSPIDVLASSLQQGSSLPKKIKIQYTQIRVQQNGQEIPANTVVESQNQEIEVLYDWQIPDGQQIKANDYFMVNDIPKSFQAASALGLNIDVVDARGQVIANGQYNGHANKIKFIFKNDLPANDLKGYLKINFKATYNEKGWANFKINQQNYRIFDDRYQQRDTPVTTNDLNDQYLPIKKSGRYDYDPKTKQLTYTWRIFLNHAKLNNDEFVIRDTLPEYLKFDAENLSVHYGHLILKKDADNRIYVNNFNRQGEVSGEDISVKLVHDRELVIQGKVVPGYQYDYEISYTTSIGTDDANFKYLREGNDIKVKNVVQLEDNYGNVLGGDVTNLSFLATGQGVSNYIEPGKLAIIKQGENDQKLLAGAKFSLYDQNNNLVKSNLKTDQNGYALVDNLKPGQYLLKEMKAPVGYQIDNKDLTVQIDEGQLKTVTVKNKLQPTLTEVNGNLKWFDKHNLKNYRPQQVGVNLMQNGQLLKTTIVSAKDRWNYHFEKLPEFDENGQRYQYTVNESEIFKYKTKQDGFDFIHVLNGTTSIQGQKIWQDQNNEAGLRPRKVEIELIRNKKVVQKIQIGAKNQWQYQFDNLAQYDNRGREYKYDVAEVVNKNYVTQKDGYDFINVFKPIYIKIHGHKTWIDNDNAEKTRPKQITVKLIKNGKMIHKKVITAHQKWNYEFNQLEKYDEKGDLNRYQIEEDPVKGYKTHIDGFNLKNTLKDGQTKIQGKKIWQDDNDHDKFRPKEIILELMQANNVVATQIVTKQTQWQYVFKKLPKYQNGVKLNYQVREKPVEYYQIKYKNNDIYNTLVGTTQVTGQKYWKDQDNKAGLRPKKITIKLLQNGAIYRTAKIGAKDGWHYTFKALPKYDQLGKAYQYTVSENKVPGYDSRQQGNDFINQIKPLIVVAAPDENLKHNTTTLNPVIYNEKVENNLVVPIIKPVDGEKSKQISLLINNETLEQQKNELTKKTSPLKIKTIHPMLHQANINVLPKQQWESVEEMIPFLMDYKMFSTTIIEELNKPLKSGVQPEILRMPRILVETEINLNSTKLENKKNIDLSVIEEHIDASGKQIDFSTRISEVPNIIELTKPVELEKLVEPENKPDLTKVEEKTEIPVVKEVIDDNGKDLELLTKENELPNIIELTKPVELKQPVESENNPNSTKEEEKTEILVVKEEHNDNGKDLNLLTKENELPNIIEVTKPVELKQTVETKDIPDSTKEEEKTEISVVEEENNDNGKDLKLLTKENELPNIIEVTKAVELEKLVEPENNLDLTKVEEKAEIPVVKEENNDNGKDLKLLTKAIELPNIIEVTKSSELEKPVESKDIPYLTKVEERTEIPVVKEEIDNNSKDLEWLTKENELPNIIELTKPVELKQPVESENNPNSTKEEGKTEIPVVKEEIDDNGKDLELLTKANELPNIIEVTKAVELKQTVETKDIPDSTKVEEKTEIPVVKEENNDNGKDIELLTKLNELPNIIELTKPVELKQPVEPENNPNSTKVEEKTEIPVVKEEIDDNGKDLELLTKANELPNIIEVTKAVELEKLVEPENNLDLTKVEEKAEIPVVKEENNDNGKDLKLLTKANEIPNIIELTKPVELKQTVEKKDIPDSTKEEEKTEISVVKEENNDNGKDIELLTKLNELPNIIELTKPVELKQPVEPENNPNSTKVEEKTEIPVVKDENNGKDIELLTKLNELPNIIELTKPVELKQPVEPENIPDSTKVEEKTEIPVVNDNGKDIELLTKVNELPNIIEVTKVVELKKPAESKDILDLTKVEEKTEIPVVKEENNDNGKDLKLLTKAIELPNIIELTNQVELKQPVESENKPNSAKVEEKAEIPVVKEKIDDVKNVELLMKSNELSKTVENKQIIDLVIKPDSTKVEKVKSSDIVVVKKVSSTMEKQIGILNIVGLKTLVENKQTVIQKIDQRNINKMCIKNVIPITYLKVVKNQPKEMATVDVVKSKKLNYPKLPTTHSDIQSCSFIRGIISLIIMSIVTFCWYFRKR
ncbi:Cna B-type domain-containing protein [Weissella koreensis]|uniref:Cna B-type domain-containing protein n=1 Tax=Weissella koreensis TaxID=165096 RepID=UPI0013051698|nr:Cna B-type domain-containing protein [Weissella koreensis]